ncbi:hypothetical protein V6N13_037741 [Hibiscus sabdariffa]
MAISKNLGNPTANSMALPSGRPLDEIAPVIDLNNSVPSGSVIPLPDPLVRVESSVVVCEGGTGNLVVDDGMTETGFRNEGNNDIIQIPNEAMVVDDQYGTALPVGSLGQSDRMVVSKDSQKPSFRDMLTGVSGSHFGALSAVGEGEVNPTGSGNVQPMAKGGVVVYPTNTDLEVRTVMEPRVHNSPSRRVRATSSSVPLVGTSKVPSLKTSKAVQIGDATPEQLDDIGVLASTYKEVVAIQGVNENDSMVPTDQVEGKLVRGKSIAAKANVIHAPSSLSLDKRLSGLLIGWIGGP